MFLLKHLHLSKTESEGGRKKVKLPTLGAFSKIILPGCASAGYFQCECDRKTLSKHDVRDDHGRDFYSRSSSELTFLMQVQVPPVESVRSSKKGTCGPSNKMG